MGCKFCMPGFKLVF